MDANEVLTESGQLRNFISTTGLEDAIQILNPVHAQHRPTFMKSKNRLDYIFTTPDVIQCSHDAGHYDVWYNLPDTLMASLSCVQTIPP